MRYPFAWARSAEAMRRRATASSASERASASSRTPLASANWISEWSSAADPIAMARNLENSRFVPRSDPSATLDGMLIAAREI